MLTSTIVHTLTMLHHSVVHQSAVGNPAPQAPAGIGAKANQIMGIVKWGALFVIIAAGFIGAGATAAGHFLSNQRSSQVGIKVLIGAVAAAVLYAGIYAFLTGVTG